MEWLKHSNKSVQQCDICHTPYKFKTIYDPSMPDSIPFEFIWEKICSNIVKNFTRSISIMLYVFLILEVPIFWKFMGRIYTWTIDGKLPSVNDNFIDALFFGENVIQSEYSNSIINLAKIKKLFEVSYFSGLRYIFIYIIIHIALFIEREWVIRDEGFTKLLIKRVGAEPRTKLIDVFQNVINDMEEDDERMNVFLRAVNDMRQGQEVEIIEDNHWYDNSDAENTVNENVHERRVEEDADEDESSDDNENGNESSNMDNGWTYDSSGDIILDSDEYGHYNRVEMFSDFRDDDTEEIMERERSERERMDIERLESETRERERLERERMERERLEVERLQRERTERERVERERIERERQERERIEREERERAREIGRQADAEEGDENIFEMFGFKLNISVPIFLLAICNTVVGTYLFFTYLIPQMIGCGLIFFLNLTFQAVSLVLPSYNLDVESKYQYVISKLNPSARNILDSIVLNIAILLKSLGNLFTNEETPSSLERAITLTLGYSAVALVVYQFMKSLVRSKPVTGTPRKIYKVLFEVAITLKVFVIFAIEIFFFPVYCGWLIDFCVAPLLLESFHYKIGDNSYFHVLFTSTIPFLTIDYIRISIYWACGTLYMLFFALFIGMVRSKILRPGVLFFIRSPDDPNARLIHDALVKPMLLQLSRIYLSGKVYSAFIIVGIGGLTWGLRFFIQEKDKNVLLPIKLYNPQNIIFIFVFASAISTNKIFLKHLSERYWKTAFELSCHKLRLSHFILGKPIPQERGYVAYSSIYHWFFQTPPNYSNPVTYKESIQLGNKEPSYFIPNGDYIRVPDNDTVSRKFIKKLFVSVTKDDKLLKPLEPIDTVDEGDESDDELSENSYAIVYKPPYLKFRCFMLIVFLWVWSIILILSVVMVALFIGKPVMKILILIAALSENLFEFSIEIFNKSINQYDWRVADFGSLAIGLICEIFILKWFYKAEAQEFAPDLVINLQARLANYSQSQVVGASLLMFSSLLLNQFWIITIHKFGVDAPLGILKNPNTFKINNEFSLELKALLLHLIASYWTVIPFTRRLFKFQIPQNYDLSLLLKILDTKMLVRDIFFIQTPFFAFVFVKYYLGSFNSWDLMLFPGLFGLYIAWDFFKYAKSIFIKFNNEVKNEKYVTGRALENVF
ncbi:ERAD-associated E3 ubiquitin-protein ligase DOA10 [[Candida] jaroonii]|uniref:ERAD-associated E3 ubiquitin-protein ligase DOA10 n=1 Tax=[Candida] jaroonii TaxID=467808 RepID=A0ACA9Y7Q2_9ASCO|nr:ERAD-associated E3 ubiquitin-protein ligase DOA10 [[Candida] jaroonii]